MKSPIEAGGEGGFWRVGGSCICSSNLPSARRLAMACPILLLVEASAQVGGNTSLPWLPQDTGRLTIGTAGSGFDGIVSLAGPLSLDGQDVYEAYGKTIMRSANVFADLVNGPRGGLHVGGKRLAVQFTFVGDHSAVVQVENATRFALLSSGADFALGPYSSGLTRLASTVSFNYQKIMMACCASTASVIAQNNLTFGMLPPATSYLTTSISMVASKATALGQLADLRIGFIQADAVFTKTTCSAGPSQAAANGITMAPGALPIPTIPKTPTLAEAKVALAGLRAAGVNVIAGCTYSSTGAMIITALQELNYSVLALVLTSTNVPSWEGEYVVSPSPWHPTLPGVGSFTNWTAAQFVEAYAAEYGGDTPVYQGASFFGGMAALGAAIEAAGTLETEAVASQLRSLDMFDVFGRTRFDGNGQGLVAMIPLQHAPGSGSQAIISEASLAFPMPPWPQRWCQQLGPGKTYADNTGEVLGMECSGHGQCDARGACVCAPGFDGESCDKPVLQVQPQTTNHSGLIVIAVSVPVFLIASLIFLCVCARRRERAAGLLRLKRTGGVPDFPLPKAHQWHLFLSHK